MASFAYRKEFSSVLGEIMRPVADVELKAASGHWFPASMYIDSGADMTLIPSDFGKLLGMDLTENRSALAGVTGVPLKVSLHSTFIRIGRSVHKAKVAVALRNDVPYLLGREGVFKAFRITFEEYKNVTSFHLSRQVGRGSVLDLAGFLNTKEAADLRSTVREIRSKSRSRIDETARRFQRS